jgi:K+-transporting ATPase ATPase B chain
MRALKGAVESIRNFVGYPEEKDDSELDQVYQRVCQQGGTPLAVCLDNEIYGVIYLRDIVKPGIRDRFEQLRRIGIDTVMVTGDNQITSSVIAQEAGVNEFVAEATPEDKVELIQKYQAEGKLVAMAGDGNNDAAALGKANVGIAMNTGTQAAKQASKLVDLDSDPTKLIDIVTVGKELLITRGALTAFSITNDIAKYFAIIPTLFAGSKLQGLNIMNLTSIQSAILSTLIYNLLVIPAVIPFALGGIKFIPLNPNRLLLRNVLIFGLGGVIIPFIVIKAVDLIITAIGLA